MSIDPNVVLGAIQAFAATVQAVLSTVNRPKITETKSSVGQSESPRNDSIAKHFHSIVTSDCNQIDYFFYQFGLRPTLPIIDWLYLEYVKYLHKTKTIKNFICFPTVDSSLSTCQKTREKQLDALRTNIGKVFKNSGIQPKIESPYTDTYFDKTDLTSEEFIQTLNYIGHHAYFEILQAIGVPINSISDFNKYHPIDDSIKNIVTHIYKSWCVVKYVQAKISLGAKANTSALFWEWEADKLGVMTYYFSHANRGKFHPILGKTQYLRKDQPNETDMPVPVFINDQTLCVFDKEESLMSKAVDFIDVLDKYNSLLGDVLLQYEEYGDVAKNNIQAEGEKRWKNFILTHNATKWRKITPTSDFCLFLGLIGKFRDKYEIT